MSTFSTIRNEIAHRGPIGIANYVFNNLFLMLVSLPATIAVVGFVLLLSTSGDSMARSVVTELVKFQAQGADSAPSLLHLEICDKQSPVAILCNSHSVKTYTIDEATADLETMAIKAYAALVIASVLWWLVFCLPSGLTRASYAHAIRLPARSITPAEERP